MTATDIIREVQENASEWLEMSENPTEMLVGLLASKLSKVNDYVEYLEKRIKDYERSNANSRGTPTGKC